MADLFQAKEVVDLGIIIETNGEAFYRHLRETAQDAKARDVYSYLEAEERKHKAAFEKMGESLSDYESHESYEGEHASYMRALADKNVFTKKDVGLDYAKQAANAIEAIDMALGFENDSVVFFEGMRRFIPAKEHSAVDRLVREEKNHIEKLTGLRKTMKG